MIYNLTNIIDAVGTNGTERDNPYNEITSPTFSSINAEFIPGTITLFLFKNATP
jgi:hypothetical protein